MNNYKSQRNKILKDLRIISGTYNGKLWSCPDDFACMNDLYDGYKPSKNQTVLDGKPLLDKIINKPENGIYKQAIATSSDDDQTQVTVSGLVTTVNKKYYDFLMALYPTARVYASTDTATPSWYKPVQLRVKSPIGNKYKLVAVIMPLKV